MPDSRPPGIPRPGRPLIALAALLVLVVAGMLLAGAVKPRLAVDLAGGTSVTLTASPPKGSDEGVTRASLDEAVAIIRQRVNSTGVAEAEVAVRGSDQIVVTVPGRNDQGLVDLIGQTALLRFRPTLLTGPPAVQPAGTTAASDGVAADVAAAYDALDCTDPATRQGGDTAAADAAVAACDRDGTAKYVLGPAVVEGTDLSAAQAGVPAGGAGGWEVDLKFDHAGTKQFADATTAVVSQPAPKNEIAIVLDGLVVSSPRIDEAITGGRAQITGTFTRQEATDLAHVLSYGSLPLAFEKSQVSTISPTVGSTQLTAGLVAGVIGLGLVVLYCLAYYRRLGVIAVASLVLAAGCSYAAVSLLGAQVNYRLSLAGIAGLIVAVGITADSFVVFFERIRDEMRDGRTARSAVEYGWRRARRTILVADTVSFLSAAVLYVLSADQVRGFAFALGLATVIDVLVVFLFTRPVVAYAVRGWWLRGRWSGLRFAGGRPRTSLGDRLHRGDATIDVVGHTRRWFAISGVVIVLAVGGLFARGLNLGVEFEGGAIIQTHGGSATVSEVQDVLAADGVADSQVRELGDGSIVVEIGKDDAHRAADLRGDVAEVAGVSADDVTTDVIGPSWGHDVTRKAVVALAVFAVLIVGYLSIAFAPLMALAAFVALLHDLLITVGVYALAGLTVTPATVVGVLTILGYSLYDTVVVFDKVRENTRRRGNGVSYAAAAGRAVDQTLLRSVSTSLIALLPVAGMLIAGTVTVGAQTLQDLALALFVGILAGTYSSIFIAVPLLVRWDGRRGGRDRGRSPSRREPRPETVRHSGAVV
ncbi:protein translocase subunit SecD [Jiangella mangrovi]|uniref:Multifunctional fusion protein n=1 Tax=Jiangella mangrovi TaxID=1524084 RepID=A0A7W9GRY1_9ACTN|nr:protein translocase subunit SecD [Jiangella mangrovi]MBB5788928.1 protein-export membrane protein SecD/preprotein translocase SecF subunit [Jiangella mangrovi]